MAGPRTDALLAACARQRRESQHLFLGASDHSDGGLGCLAGSHTDVLPSAGSMSRQRCVVVSSPSRLL
jgi:hypothetical protein